MIENIFDVCVPFEIKVEEETNSALSKYRKVSLNHVGTSVGLLYDTRYQS